MKTYERQWAEPKALGGKVHTETVYDFYPTQEHPTRGDWDKASNAAVKFVESNFPTAVHSGMGYWKVARQYRIFYNQARISVEKMGRHA